MCGFTYELFSNGSRQMNHNDLEYFKKWFSEYVNAFHSTNVDDQKNISLKIKHTHNVCKNIVTIATEERLSRNKVMLAEALALFHDIGRFPQYKRYKTFNDRISVNHGRFGAEVLQHEGVLQNLPKNEQELITITVRLHNALRPGKIKNTEKIFFLKLIRDADKLDIWRVFDEYYNAGASERASAATQGLPDIPGFSPKILSCIFAGKMASLKDAKTVNDFKLIQLSWVYDLNFKTSYRLLAERDYIKKFIAKLPQTDEIKKAAASLQKFVSKKC